MRYLPFFSLSILVFFTILWKWQTLTLWSYQKFSPGHWDVESLVWKCDLLNLLGVPPSRLPHWHLKGNSSWWVSNLVGCLYQLSPCLEELTPHPKTGPGTGPSSLLISARPQQPGSPGSDGSVCSPSFFFHLTLPYPSNRTASSFGLLAPMTAGS